MRVGIMRKNERWNIDTINVAAKKETVEHNGKIYKLFRFVKRNCKKLIVAFVMLYHDDGLFYIEFLRQAIF